MNIIEKIEIKHFRSFGDSKATIIENINDLNIFSGANDSGKSNILRALNLFFHENKIDFDDDFYFQEDFSRAHEDRLKGQKKGKSFIEIGILFSPKDSHLRSKVLPLQFWIYKRFYEKKIADCIKIKDLRGANIKYYVNKDNKRIEKPAIVKRAATSFLKKINFQYVPAIKDKVFFDYLKKNYQEAISQERVLLGEKEKKTLPDWIKIMNSSNITKILDEKLKDESEKMFLNFLDKAQELDRANFLITNLEISYSDMIDIETDENISLKNRGDGVQAKFIPIILDEIANRNKKQPIVIWAFEEPENSFEYRNAQKLANEFLEEYAKKNKHQIFITTHSFNFLTLSGGNVSTYRVYKELVKVRGPNKKESDYDVSRVFHLESDLNKRQVSLFKLKFSEREKLEEELGLYDFNSDLQQIYQEKQKELIEDRKNYEIIERELSEIKPKNIFICEDECGIKIWEIFFKKSSINNVKVISSRGCDSNVVDHGINHVVSLAGGYSPKVFRSLDRDGYMVKQVKFLEGYFENKNKKISGVDNYKFRFLPVNELENFAILVDSYFKEELLVSAMEKLEIAFNKTANKNCVKLCKNKVSDSDLFGRHDDNEEQKCLMRNEAGDNMLKFFPGKDIKALKSNFDVIKFLIDLSKEDYPDDLKLYLQEIKIFFK